MRLQTSFLPALVVGFAIVIPVAADALYTATDLGGNFNARAINNSGEVAGQSYYPATYSGGAVTALESTFAGYSIAINNSGQVVGSVIQGPVVFGFVYSGGTATYLSTPATYPFGINGLGMVVGGMYPYFNAPAMEPFSYFGGKITLLNAPGATYGTATAINDAGQIAGWSSLADGAILHAFLYSNGNLIDIGTLPGGNASQANAINCKGQVVGISIDSAAGGLGTAFTYSNGVIASLGTLPGAPASDAQAVNCSSQVVGSSGNANGSQSRAFLYENSTMYDLNSLVSSGTVLTTAPGINDSGQIIATGANGHSYLLTPVNPSACPATISPGGNIFTAAGGSATISIFAGPNCSWTVSGAPPWVTITSGASGTGAGSVSYSVAPNGSAISLSSVLTIGSVPYAIQEQGTSAPSFIGSMPHIAAEGGWNTTFTFVNKSATSLQTQCDMFDNSGNPLALPLTFPQRSAKPLTEASLNQPVPANASLVVEASGPGNIPFQEGSAELNSAGVIDGFAIFHYSPTNQEAVVPIETRNATSYLLAFDNTNGVLTGVAIENVSTLNATIQFTIRNEAGATVGTGSVALRPLGHTSFVLPTQYPAAANIRGTVEIFAPGFPTPGRIAVLGIRYTGGTLTTIPALSSLSPPGGLMAHLASGAGWQTTFALVNTGPTTANATLNFFADGGSALALPLTSLQTGTTTNSSTAVETLAPGASVWIQSAAPTSTNLLTGSAQLTTTGNISGYAIFRYNTNGQEAVVPIEGRNSAAYLIAFDNTNSTTTGVAISAMPTVTILDPAIVPVVVRDDSGNTLTTGIIQLNPNGHTSFSLAQQFPSTAGIRGTIEFDAPTRWEISILGIRSPPALTFTSLPPLAK